MTKKQVEHLIEEIKATHKEGNIFFPWSDVFASMAEEPDRVIEIDETCPECGKNLVEFFFSTPGWTWEKLCGTAGRMWICPKCGEQVEFYLGIKVKPIDK